MKKVSIFITLSLVSIASFSQYDPSKIDKKATQYFAQAMERVQEENYASAAGFLQQSIEADKNYVDAYLILANIYGKLGNHRNSIQQFEKAFAIDTAYTITDKLAYSKQLASIGEFQKALDAITEFLNKKPPKNETSLIAALKRKHSYEFAVSYAKVHAEKNYVFEPRNLGASVNSSESEYFPVVTIEGNELIFTRRVDNRNEDFYTARMKEGNWEKARSMEGNVNTPQSEAAQSISSDGQLLVFTATGRGDGFGNYDLYSSQNNAWGWGDATNLGAVVNSEQWDSQPCLSPDKRDLYFASRRSGGFGGSDIYVTHLLPNGRWSEPENLGAGINTSGDDQCPFIHADNQTLYFTSNGWPGYGENDLFYARRNANGNWAQPVNLGFPINTINDEGTLFIAADGKTAYYASDRSDSKGGLDIYTFELPQDVRPYKTVWVRGTVKDKKTNKNIPSTVQLIDLSSRQIISNVSTDASGNYLVNLPVGKDYAFNVSEKGYLFYSDNFLLSKSNPDSTYEKNILLQPIEANASIVLKNIFFDVNKFDLKSESTVELDKLVQLLKENPTLKIEISGHTDNVGKPADNLTLSNNRAKSVVDYLIRNGISNSRLSARGYGETKPVADNKTDEGRAVNRRTEMKVISQ
jgi:outer membrane protein OmpA-like peptidoglycan-associated protein/tetratricopeptide (TPR) repeat protein